MRLQEVGVNLIKAINATSRRNRYETHPENRTKSKWWAQTGSVQSLSDRRWTHTHPHYSSTTHMDSQTLPTHSVLFLFLLIQTIFAMGRCCSLSTRSTCRNPRPIAPTATAMPYTYSTSYP